MHRAIFRTKHVIFSLSFLLLLAFPVAGAQSENHITMDENMAMGVPFGTVEKPDFDLCPYGVRVIGMFMVAWQKSDYRTMYELIDDESKKDYSFEDAKLDFQFLKFKEYRISSVRRSGEDFAFILTYGDWRDGNKDTKKMLISGKTFKIIMSTRNSPFKESVASYF